MHDDHFVPPHSEDAERAVLGGLLLDSRKLIEIADTLAADDFYRRDHALLYRSIVEMQAVGKPCDSVTMADWFEQQGLAELVGGKRYVIDLANETPGSANVAAYAEIVREKSRKRALLTMLTKAHAAASENATRATDVIATVQQQLAAAAVDTRLGGPRSVGAEISAWYEGIVEGYRSEAKLTGIETPWRGLTDLTDGWQPLCYMLAARPNMGKSAVGFQASGHAALAGQPALVFSMEMGRKAFIDRVVASCFRIRHEHLRKPRTMADGDWPTLTTALSLLREAPLMVDDQPGLTTPQIVARMKREHMRRPLKLVVVDHLHRIALPGVKKFGELADSAQMLTDAAKSMGVCLLLLLQLNRSPTKREDDKRPRLDDLRGDGGLEESADIVLFLHREDYYDRHTHLKDVVELIVGKGRDLPTGEMVPLRNRFDQMRLEDWEGPLPEKPVSRSTKKEKGAAASAAERDSQKAAANDRGDK